jgi:hypothetical protein
MSEEKISFEGLANGFFMAIDNLVALNIGFRQLQDPDYRRSMHPAQYAFEHCTVQLNIGRHTGKTEYIKRNAVEGALVVVPNEVMRREFLRSIKDSTSKAYVVNASTTEHLINDLSHRKFNFILIDEPSLLSDEAISAIYQFTAKADLDQIYVLLGA